MNAPSQTADAADITEEGVATAQQLLANALHVVLGAKPVENPQRVLPINTHNAADQEGAWEYLRAILGALLSSPHAATCPADRPAALVSTVHRVVCADCITAKELRGVIRSATRPTGFDRVQFTGDPEKWLRATALVCAASLAHYDDPSSFITALLDDAPDQ